MRVANAMKIVCVVVAVLTTTCIARPMKRQESDEVSSAPNCRARLPSSSTSPAPSSSTIAISSSSTSSPPPKPTIPAPKPYTFNIEISNQRQHVGNWYEYLGSDIKKALKNKCDDDEFGANTCSPDPYPYKPIEYSRQNGLVESEKGTAEVTVSSAYIPEANHEEFQTAFIDQIADTFMIAASDEKNCYWFDRKADFCTLCQNWLCGVFMGISRSGQRDTRGQYLRWCNAPEYVRVSVSDIEGKEIAHMKVNLKFLGETDQGKFDCVGVIEAVDQNARDGRLAGLKEVVGGKDVETVVACSSKEVTGSCPLEKDPNLNCLYKFGKCF